MVKSLFDYLNSVDYKHHIISPSAEIAFDWIHSGSSSIYHSIDERSAGYIATGMCEELGRPVVIWVKSNASFRNLSPALTEAYYKKLPLIVVTIPSETPVSQEISPTDILVGRISYNNEDGIISSINNIWDEKRVGPLLLEIKEGEVYYSNPFLCPKELLDFLSEDTLIYADEGGFSSVIGIAASTPDSRVTCILPFTELVYELNMFGNRHIRNNMLIVSYCNDMQVINVIANFAYTLGWFVAIIDTEADIKELAFFNKPSIVIIRKKL